MLSSPSTKKICFYQAISIGFYFYYWCSKSRQDITKAAARSLIPSPWLLIIPLANYWWMWRYANALDFVSYGRIKYTDTFLLYVLALNFAVFFGSMLRVVGFIDSQNTKDIILVVIVLAVLLLLTSIASMAFFCSVMQHKITNLAQTQKTS